MHVVTLSRRSKIKLSSQEGGNHLLVGHYEYNGTVESGVCIVLSARSPLQLRLDIHSGEFSRFIGAQTPRSLGFRKSDNLDL